MLLRLLFDDDGTAVAKQALVGSYPDSRALHLPITGLAAQLPGQFTDLRQCLCRHSLTEAGESAGDIHRYFPAESRVAGAQQRRSLTPWGQLQVFDPVQFQRG